MRTDDVINLLVQDLATPGGNARTTLHRWLPLAALAAGGTFLAVAGVRDDLLTEGLAPTATKLALGALLASGATVASIQLARPDSAPAAAMRWLAGAGLFLAIMVLVGLAGVGPGGWTVRLFGRSVLSCLTMIPTIAALPLVASLIALRHGATTFPAATGACAGLASAGLAVIAYGLFCTEDSPLFVASWYTLAAGLVGLAGAALGRAVLRW